MSWYLRQRSLVGLAAQVGRTVEQLQGLPRESVDELLAIDQGREEAGIWLKEELRKEEAQNG